MTQNLIMSKINWQCQRFAKIDLLLVCSCCEGRVGRVILTEKNELYLAILSYIAQGFVFFSFKIILRIVTCLGD